MNNSSQKQPKSFKTFFQSQLLMMSLEMDRLQFTIFNFTHQLLINHTQFLLSTLRQNLETTGQQKTLAEVFHDIKMNPEDFIKLKNDTFRLKVKLSKIKKCPQESLDLELQLVEKLITPSESIFYLKQFSKAKDEHYKTEILKLKSKIYSLMTEVEDATNLIRSQSLQTKSSKEQIKNLKNELKILQQEKKKQQETFLIEVGVQHEFSFENRDIVEWLECPQVKQFSIDDDKLKNLTRFIELQIKENQKILYLATENLVKPETEPKRPSSQTNILEEEQDLKAEPERVKYSPDKVCLFEKATQRFRLQNYSLKTLESS